MASIRRSMSLIFIQAVNTIHDFVISLIVFLSFNQAKSDMILKRQLLPKDDRILTFFINHNKIMLTVNYPHIKKIKNSSAYLECFPRIRIAQIVMDYLAYGWLEEINTEIQDE